MNAGGKTVRWCYPFRKRISCVCLSVFSFFFSSSCCTYVFLTNGHPHCLIQFTFPPGHFPFIFSNVDAPLRTRSTTLQIDMNMCAGWWRIPLSLFRSLARSLSHSQWSLLIHLLSAIMVKAWPNVIVWRPKMKYWPNDENEWQPIRCYFKWQMVLWEIFPFFPLTLWMDAMAVWLDVGANFLYAFFRTVALFYSYC